MSVWLGVRLALAGGREGLVRALLTTLGTAIGVALLLFGLTVMPALQGRIDRYAWHRTDAASAATAPDAALWLPVTDRLAGRDLVRIQVAALGEQPPVPPGLDRLPAPGEVFVSPALAALLPTLPDSELRLRFPGRIAGTIGPDGLVAPDELVAVVGRTREELRGAQLIRGIERPGEELDLKSLVYAVLAVLAVLVVGPVLIFVSMVTRINAARRERRFAAMRLAGASRGQTGLMAAVETAVAAIAGTLAGWGAYAALLPVAARSITYEALHFPREDLVAPAAGVALVLTGVPLLAVATTLTVLRRAQISPLGTQRQASIPRPSAWRLVPLGIGIAGVAETVRQSADRANADTLPYVRAGSLLCVLLGFVLSGPWACMWLARCWARLARSAPAIMAARRIEADPYTAFRAVSGVAVATFVAALVACIGPTDGFDAGFRLVMVFVLLVAASSLTVSVIAGLIERRRPFALLRASGVRVSQLRRIALLETAVPLLLTMAGAVVVALGVTYLAVKREDWVAPGAGFFLSLGAGALIAVGVSLLSWPLMDAVTRHDAVRFE